MTALVLADKHADRLRRMRRGVLSSARAIHNDLVADGYFQWEKDCGHRWASSDDLEFRCALLTLTYDPAVEWEPGHVRVLLDHYRKWAKRNKCRFSYVWVVETHESGKPHYHAVFWVSGGKTPPFPDQQGWWPHGHSNAVWAKSPVGYIAKYASKGHKHALPADCRLWGAGGLTARARAEKSWVNAPKWLRAITEPGTLIKRASMQIKEVYQSGKEAVFNVVSWFSEASQISFFSPWEYNGMTSTGVALRHKGFIEGISQCGEVFRITHINPLGEFHEN